MNTVCWLQITAGQGPKECGWVVAQLYKVMKAAAQKEKLIFHKVEALAYDKPGCQVSVMSPNAFRSILVRVEGRAAEMFRDDWRGTIQWQGNSSYRPAHKRTNWYVAVVALTVPQAVAINQETFKQDLRIEAMRAKGPGGQHVNKTNSAVRVTHQPTGIQVKVSADRSQHRNRQIAIERLQGLLIRQANRVTATSNHDRWLSHYQVRHSKPGRIFHGKGFKSQPVSSASCQKPVGKL